MAYKFQRGDAILSGSIKAEDGLVGTDVDQATADFVVAQINNGDIAIAKLAASTISGKSLGANLDALSVTAEKGLSMTSYDGQAAVSDLQVVLDGAGGLEFNGASGIRLEAAVAGNGLAHSAGVLSVQTSGSIVIDGDKIGISGSFAGPGLLSAGGPNSISSLEIAFDDSSIELDVNGDLAVKALGVTNAMLAGSIADSKLSTIATANKVSGTAIQLSTNTAIEDSSGLRLKATTAGDGLAISADQVLSINVDDSSIEIDSDSLRVKAGGISNSMLADDAVGADELASNAVVDASVASNAAILASKINFNTDLGGNISFGNQADDDVTFGGGVVVAGNLTVQGSTTTVDSTTINISSSFTFEGPADDHETILTCATPGADTTLSLPTLSAGSYFIPALADAATDASAAVTAAEFALLDGASADSSVTIADADQMIINDGGVMKQTAMSDIKSYVAGASTLSVAVKADGNALEEDKVNYFADLSSNATVTLPASAAGLIGKSIYIKAKDLTSGATIIINTQAADQKIDGENSIVLESPYASVRLIYVATDDWRVF